MERSGRTVERGVDNIGERNPNHQACFGLLNREHRVIPRLATVLFSRDSSKHSKRGAKRSTSFVPSSIGDCKNQAELCEKPGETRASFGRNVNEEGERLFKKYLRPGVLKGQSRCPGNYPGAPAEALFRSSVQENLPVRRALFSILGVVVGVVTASWFILGHKKPDSSCADTHHEECHFHD